ncbi:MAG: erythromycin esterase family protein, partial [Myxococcales bacterium]
INRFVKEGTPGGARQVLGRIHRWPTWMWANQEVRAMAEWLVERNARHPVERRVGWYGLDVYSLWESMDLVVSYLDRVDPEAGRRARRAYECFAPYGGEAEQYAYSIALSPDSCEESVVKALLEVRRAGREAIGSDRERAFFAEQNALIARDAERYYRAMIRSGPHSWNVRDQHMTDTLDRLMEFHGPGARAIVWAHNTHVGDARHTDMAEAGEFNIGQQVRERHADEGVVLVGFTTHQGTVIAGDGWGEPMRTMTVPPGREGSFEDALHRVRADDQLMIFDRDATPPVLMTPRGHRAIGVVYRPEVERFGNYVPTVLPLRYDALLHIDRSHAVTPLPVAVDAAPEPPETYPTGA